MRLHIQTVASIVVLRMVHGVLGLIGQHVVLRVDPEYRFGHAFVLVLITVANLVLLLVLMM